MKKIFTGLLAAFSVSQAAAAIELDPTAVWVDVRTAGEYRQGHVSHAINIPHTEIATRLNEIDAGKTDPIYVYCRSGNRSGQALRVLQGLGYSNVTNLGGHGAAKKLSQSAQ